MECARSFRQDCDLGRGNGIGIQDLLSFLFRLNSTESYNPTAPLIIICDDMGPMAQAMNTALHLVSNDDESTPLGSESESLLASSLLLASLLSAIADSVSSATILPRVVVLASCCLSAKAGVPPGLSFEKTIAIPRPKGHDRELLFNRGLADLNLEAIDDDAYRSETRIDPAIILDNHRVWSFHLARLTRGYRPGDISRVLDRARTMTTSNNCGAGACLTWKLMLRTLSLVRPQQVESLREIAKTMDPEALRLSWDDFVGQSDVKLKLRRILRQMEVHSADSRCNRLVNAIGSLNSGIIIHGATGSGKSYLAKIIACEGKANFVNVRCTELLSKYFGETEANIRAVFQSAVAPCIIFFDEFDVFAHRR